MIKTAGIITKTNINIMVHGKLWLKRSDFIELHEGFGNYGPIMPVKDIFGILPDFSEKRSFTVVMFLVFKNFRNFAFQGIAQLSHPAALNLVQGGGRCHPCLILQNVGCGRKCKSEHTEAKSKFAPPLSADLFTCLTDTRSQGC